MFRASRDAPRAPPNPNMSLLIQLQTSPEVQNDLQSVVLIDVDEEGKKMCYCICIRDNFNGDR